MTSNLDVAEPTLDARGHRINIGGEVAKLVYSAIASLDGYVEDADGRFDWAMPDDELHAFLNQLERPIGTHLYGRRMYETMVYWETAGLGDDAPEVSREFGSLWRAAEKIVFSTTALSVTSSRTRTERAFDPAAIRSLKQSREADLSVGGAELAGQALRAGLVDEMHLFHVPVIVGGGKPATPAGLRTGLRLLDTRGFPGGVVYARYAVEP